MCLQGLSFIVTISYIQYLVSWNLNASGAIFHTGGRTCSGFIALCLQNNELGYSSTKIDSINTPSAHLDTSNVFNPILYVYMYIYNHHMSILQQHKA